MSPYRPLFVDAEAAIEAEHELERMIAHQEEMTRQIERMWRSYEDVTAIPRIGAYLNLGITWPRGATLGFSDLLRDL